MCRARGGLFGGWLSPPTRTLTHLVEAGQVCPASTRWV